jgi:hypothetical protein
MRRWWSVVGRGGGECGLGSDPFCVGAFRTRQGSSRGRFVRRRTATFGCGFAQLHFGDGEIVIPESLADLVASLGCSDSVHGSPTMRGSAKEEVGGWCDKTKHRTRYARGGAEQRRNSA